MKSICVIIIFMTASLSIFGQVQKRKPIVVMSINFHTLPFKAVSCKDFPEAYKNRIDTTTISSADTIRMMDSFIVNKIKSTKPADLDVKCRFYFFNKKGRRVIICMDQFNIAVDGFQIEKNPAFFQFLRSLIPKKQFKS